MNAEEFTSQLSTQKDQKLLFNPFKDICKLHDLKNADKIRINNLKIYLEAQERNKPRHLWVAEAPGYNGSRRSGVYLVSEKQFEETSKILNSKPFNKATTTEAKDSITAKAIFNMMKELNEFPLTFDIMPFHPFKNNIPLSNRTPTKKEINNNIHYMKVLIDWFKPKQIIAIGRKAETALKEMNINCIYVRHPAQGGQKEFSEGIKKIYNIYAFHSN